MSISDEEQKKAVSVVLSKLRQKGDLRNQSFKFIGLFIISSLSQICLGYWRLSEVESW